LDGKHVPENLKKFFKDFNLEKDVEMAQVNTGTKGAYQPLLANKMD
jgi:hypothetical protein